MTKLANKRNYFFEFFNRLGFVIKVEYITTMVSDSSHAIWKGERERERERAVKGCDVTHLCTFRSMTSEISNSFLSPVDGKYDFFTLAKKERVLFLVTPSFFSFSSATLLRLCEIINWLNEFIFQLQDFY